MISKEVLETIERKLEKNFKELEEDLGVKILWNGGTYNDSEGQIKIKVLPDRKEMERLRKSQFQGLAIYYGLEAEDYGKKVVDEKHGEITIVGIKPSGRKYCIIVKDKDNKEFLISITYARKLLGRD